MQTKIVLFEMLFAFERFWTLLARKWLFSLEEENQNLEYGPVEPSDKQRSLPSEWQNAD